MATPNTHFGAEKISEIMKCCENKTVFFLGAGGVMMSSLALLTKRAGYKVKGSDRSRSTLTDKLCESGIELFFNHSSSNLGDDCGAVVYTVAVSADNPEYSRAQRENIPCISRADYLGYLMTEYNCRIGVSGMHGKSSCTSMCAEILLRAEKNKNIKKPTIVSGAVYAPMGGAYHIGENDIFLFEACEYMDSFLDFNPTVAVLLNAELEHVDYFKSIEQIRESFARFASLTGEQGRIIYNADDENIILSVRDIKAEKISFGIENEAYISAKSIKTDVFPMEFELYIENKSCGKIKLPAMGRHNVYNALASVGAALASGISLEDIKEGLEGFKGVNRRMEYRGKVMGADIFDDYGHHPTEVKATLDGAKNICKGRLICAFQPHTYSRTAAFADIFSEAFSSADKVILADIYSARETDDLGISSQKLAKMIGEKAICAGSLENVAQAVKKEAKEGDTVVIMGAGDIVKVFGLLGL